MLKNTLSYLRMLRDEVSIQLEARSMWCRQCRTRPRVDADGYCSEDCTIEASWDQAVH